MGGVIGSVSPVAVPTARTRGDACLCGAQAWQTLFHYDAPPPGETQFNFVNQLYTRDFIQCQRCGHCRAVHELALEKLYEKKYMAATYGDSLLTTYEAIMALPEEQSDNMGRVAWLTDKLGRGEGRSVLDVGSGLCVFLARMKEMGWIGCALDPDAAAVAHARSVVGVTATKADWVHADLGGQQYDLVSFNKVIEHIEEPLSFLHKALTAVAPAGHLYVEVPDGEAALKEGAEREEFFVEHWHAFSPLSLLFLLREAGWRVQTIERLREASGKYTLRALATIL